MLSQNHAITHSGSDPSFEVGQISLRGRVWFAYTSFSVSILGHIEVCIAPLIRPQFPLSSSGGGFASLVN